MNSRKLVVAALGLAGALCGGVAMAHGNDDVQWSVTIGSQVGTPVYTQPAPVYTQPAPVYGYGRPVVVAPAYGWRDHRYHRPTRWDVDGDGIPNRYDRLYNPRWDRDGDGIPDRYDRYDNNRAGYGWRR